MKKYLFLLLFLLTSFVFAWPPDLRKHVCPVSGIIVSASCNSVLKNPALCNSFSYLVIQGCQNFYVPKLIIPVASSQLTNQSNQCFGNYPSIFEIFERQKIYLEKKK